MSTSNCGSIVDPSYRRQLLYLWQGSKVRFKWAEVISLALGRERNATLLRWQHQGYKLLKNLFKVDRTGELTYAGQWDENGWLEITHREIKSKSGMKTRHDVSTFLLQFERAGLIDRKHLINLDEFGQPYKRLFIRLRPEGLLQQLNRQDAPELAVVEVQTEKVSAEPRDEYGVTEEITLKIKELEAAGKGQKGSENVENSLVLSFLAPIAENDATSSSLVTSSSSRNDDQVPENKNQNALAGGVPLHKEVKLRYLKLAQPGSKLTVSLAVPPELLDILDYLTVNRWTRADWQEKDVKSLLYWFNHPNPVIALTLERVKKWFRLFENNGELEGGDEIKDWMWNSELKFFCSRWGAIWKGIRMSQLRSAKEVMEMEQFELQPEVLMETIHYDIQMRSSAKMVWGENALVTHEQFLTRDIPSLPLHPLTPFVYMTSLNCWSEKVAQMYKEPLIRFLSRYPRAVDTLTQVNVDLAGWFRRMNTAMPDWKKLKTLADRNWNATRLEMELY